MARRKRIPRECDNDRCDRMFKPHRPSSRYCSIACRRDHGTRVCPNGHNLTLPGAVRKDRGQERRCVECEREASLRYRRGKGVRPREEFLVSVRKTKDEKRATRREVNARWRRRRGQQPRVVVPKSEPPKLPLELSQAYGRAGYGSMMKRKYPTRESLVAAYRRGELPIKPVQCGV